MLQIKIQNENSEHFIITKELKTRIINSVTNHLETNWDNIIQVNQIDENTYNVLIDM